LTSPPAPSWGKSPTKGRSVAGRQRDGADIALFPKVWSSEYSICDRPVCEWLNDAVPADSAFVRAVGDLAGELGTAIGISRLEKCGPLPRNSLIPFHRLGKQPFVYAMVHTCNFGAEKNPAPGGDFCVAELDTAGGEAGVGARRAFTSPNSTSSSCAVTAKREVRGNA